VRALLALAALLVAGRAEAQEDPPAYTLHGFVLTDHAVRARGGHDFMLGEERGRLDLALDGGELDAGARFTLEASHDAIADRAGVELRDAYVDYRVGPLDVRLGRQRLSWGVGDLAFVNDVFAKDLGAFFLGRPMDYLEVPSDAARVGLSVPPVTLDLVLMPFFSADRGLVALPEGTPTPTPSLAHTEVATRLLATVLETDLALYAFHGYFHTPSFVPEPVFPRRAVLGASLQRNLLGGVLSAEAGLEASRDNPHDRDPLLPRSSGKWLARYEREWIDDFTLGLQYGGQLFRDGDYLQTLTLRATLLLAHQTLRLSLLGVVQVSERDFLIVPELEYALSDRLSLLVGATVFGDQLRDDSNVHAWARFRF
jgi:hypothetical protein